MGKNKPKYNDIEALKRKTQELEDTKRLSKGYSKKSISESK